MTELFRVFPGVTMTAEAAAKLQPVQDAAILEATEVCRGMKAEGVAAQYIASTTIGTDSCDRYEEFSRRAPDDGARNLLFLIHTTQFGCTNMPKHSGIVAKLAQAYLRRGGM